MAAKAKKRNAFKDYFSNFGLRQICDFLMVGGMIVMIVGLCTTEVVVTVAMGIFIVASVLALVRSVKVLFSKINHRAPEYKAAIINTVIMGVVFALATFGFIWSLVM